jgi:hypothetical protein
MIIKEGYKFVDGKGYVYRCVKLYNKLVILSPHTQYLLEKAILLTRDFEIKCINSLYKLYDDKDNLIYERKLTLEERIERIEQLLNI